MGTHQIHRLVERLAHGPVAEVGEGFFQTVHSQLLIGVVIAITLGISLNTALRAALNRED